MKKTIFSKNELMFLITISLALGIRQMAMTMVMPFISTYGKTLSYSDELLIGVALGIFALTQAIFQIPFGIWSDKVGNRFVMLFGIMMITIGLVIAFFANDIYVLIFARALQGGGAIFATGYSWIGGSVDNSKRPRAMSIVGIIVGFAAAASFTLGPLLYKYLTVKKMFLMCATLMFIVWLIIFVFLKEDHTSKNNSKKEIRTRDAMKILFRNKTFIALNLEFVINNFIMISVFYIVPQYIQKIIGMGAMWKVFMPAVIIAIVCMRKAIEYVEKGYGSEITKISATITAIGICFYLNNQSFSFILIGSILFMIGYMCLSTIIPSLANDIAEDSYRGVTNGIVNSFQYIGSFVGAVVIGALWGNHKNFALIFVIIVSIIGIVTTKEIKINNIKE